MGGQIAGYREEIQFPRTVHDRQLATLQLVRLVRENLVDHLDHWIAADKQYALLAIARKTHIVGMQRHRGSNRCCLLPGAFHVETGFALALLTVQPVVKRAYLHHGAEHLDQCFVIQLGIPRTNGRVVIIEHTDHVIDHVPHIFRGAINIRPGLCTRLGNFQIAIIDHIARPEFRFRDVQAQRRQIAFVFFISHRASPARIAQLLRCNIRSTGCYNITNIDLGQSRCPIFCIIPPRVQKYEIADHNLGPRNHQYHSEKPIPVFAGF